MRDEIKNNHDGIIVILVCRNMYIIKHINDNEQIDCRVDIVMIEVIAFGKSDIEADKKLIIKEFVIEVDDKFPYR